MWEPWKHHSFHVDFWASILCNNLKCFPLDMAFIYVLYENGISVIVPTQKIDVRRILAGLFSPLQEGSDKLVKASLLICTCRGSFSLKGAWEIPSDAPFISVATRPACNLRDIVADNRTCPLWTQRTISRAGVKSDFSPVRWIHLGFYSSFSFSLIQSPALSPLLDHYLADSSCSLRS